MITLDRRTLIGFIGASAVAAAVPASAAPCVVPTRTLEDIFGEILQAPLVAEVSYSGGEKRTRPIRVGETSYGRARLLFEADLTGTMEQVTIRREDGMEICHLGPAAFDTPYLTNSDTGTIDLRAIFEP